MKKTRLALVSVNDRPGDAGSDSLNGDMLAVAVAVDRPDFAQACLLDLATTEARAIDPHAIVQQESDAVVALLALPKPLPPIRQLELAERVRQRVETAAGVGVSAGFSNVNVRKLGRAVPALLNQTPALELFCDDLLEPLIDYDARRGGQVIRTLETYFANRQQPFPTASQMGVHRNTIRYHFEVIKRLTGRSSSNPDDAFVLWLSLKARSATGAH